MMLSFLLSTLGNSGMKMKGRFCSPSWQLIVIDRKEKDNLDLPKSSIGVVNALAQH